MEQTKSEEIEGNHNDNWRLSSDEYQRLSQALKEDSERATLHQSLINYYTRTYTSKLETNKGEEIEVGNSNSLIFFPSPSLHPRFPPFLKTA